MVEKKTEANGGDKELDSTRPKLATAQTIRVPVVVHKEPPRRITVELVVEADDDPGTISIPLYKSVEELEGGENDGKATDS